MLNIWVEIVLPDKPSADDEQKDDEGDYDDPDIFLRAHILRYRRNLTQIFT